MSLELALQLVMPDTDAKDLAFIINYLKLEDPNMVTMEMINLFRQGKTKDELKDLLINGKYQFNSDVYEDVRYRMKEFELFILKPFEVDEGVLTCNKCGSNRTFSYTKQTRSGDEATTVFAVCSICNARWKI